MDTNSAQVASGLGKEVFEELLKRFDALTSKLGEAGGHIWSWYVRQAYIEGIEQFVEAFFVLLIIIVTLVYAKRLWNKAKTEDYDFDYCAGALALTLLGAVLLMWVYSCIGDGLELMLNPGYAALQNLLKLK